MPLETLVERDGADSTMGVGPGTLRIPAMLDDAVVAMRQMGKLDCLRSAVDALTLWQICPWRESSERMEISSVSRHLLKTLTEALRILTWVLKGRFRLLHS